MRIEAEAIVGEAVGTQHRRELGLTGTLVSRCQVTFVCHYPFEHLVVQIPVARGRVVALICHSSVLRVVREFTSSRRIARTDPASTRSAGTRVSRCFRQRSSPTFKPAAGLASNRWTRCL